MGREIGKWNDLLSFFLFLKHSLFSASIIFIKAFNSIEALY
jgi:hypothetical protein